MTDLILIFIMYFRLKFLRRCWYKYHDYYFYFGTLELACRLHHVLNCYEEKKKSPSGDEGLRTTALLAADRGVTF